MSFHTQKTKNNSRSSQVVFLSFFLSCSSPHQYHFSDTLCHPDFKVSPLTLNYSIFTSIFNSPVSFFFLSLSLSLFLSTKSPSLSHFLSTYVLTVCAEIFSECSIFFLSLFQPFKRSSNIFYLFYSRTTYLFNAVILSFLFILPSDSIFLSIHLSLICFTFIYLSLTHSS